MCVRSALEIWGSDCHEYTIAIPYTLPSVMFFPHDPIKIKDPFFTIVSRSYKQKNEVTTFFNVIKIFFFVIESSRVEEMPQLFAFFPTSLLSLSSPRVDIFEDRNVSRRFGEWESIASEKRMYLTLCREVLFHSWVKFFVF